MGFKIYSSTLDVCDLSSNRIKMVFNSLPVDHICGVVFCGTSDNMEYHQLLDNLRTVVSRELGRRVPITLIPQYIFPNGGLTLNIYTIDNADKLIVEEREGICYGFIENDKERLLFVEGIPSSDFAQSVRQQSDEVFEKLDSLLTSFGFEVDDIVRQWNYIGNIVAHKNGKQNYQEFNDARSAYYAKGSWHKGYPAATGIGVDGEGIIVGGIAFQRADNTGIYPIDNPLQVAAHIYSKSVLVDDDKNAIKSTPKFERAKLIEANGEVCCFVSGTAAIRGEESIANDSAKLQTVKTIENIEHLVSKENLVRYGCKPYDLHYSQLQVFIKRSEDFAEVKEVVESVFPHTPTIYSLADVCRSELLVEIEGILIS